MEAHNDDDESSLEAPRRAKSEAQEAAFEKSRAKRAANLAAFAPAPASPPSAAPPPAPVPTAKPMKPRTDKGKKRGHLVRPGTAAAPHKEPEDKEWYQPPRSGYANYVIV